jgi:TorA maturation chaperone TorD
MSRPCRPKAPSLELLKQSPAERSATPAAPEAWREECQAWAQLFGLAAALYLREPAVEQARDCLAVGQALARHLPDESFVHLLTRVSIEDIAEVKQEFFDLFFVPVSGCYCPPFGKIAGPGHSTNNGGVARVFQETGFIPAVLPGLPSYLRSLGRPDYIGFELAFLANIWGTAAVSPDNTEAKGLHETGLFFHENCLAPWAADFGRKVAETAQSNYFRACGHLTLFLIDTFEAGGPGQSVHDLNERDDTRRIFSSL